MKETKLIRLLKTFSKEELKSLGKFLESPFLKSARNTIILFDYIIKFHPDFETDKLDKEIVFKNIFPGEKYDEKKMVNHITDLMRSAKDFLIHKRLDKDEIESLIYLGNEYYDRNLLNSNFTLLKDIEGKLEPGFSTTSDYLSKLRKLNFLKSSYYTGNNDFDKSIECEIEYFVVSATQFIMDYTQFVSSKKPALNTHGIKMANNFSDAIIKCFDIDKLIKLTEKEEFMNSSLITLHYYRLKSIEQPDDLKHYYSLKEYFNKIISKVSRDEQYFMFSHLQNYCVRKVHEGNEDFKREGLEIYKIMLEHNSYSYSENEYMEILTFRNVMYFCYMLNEFEWLRYFIDKYIDTLNPEYREDMRNFSFANLYFYQKDFEKSLEYISKKFNHEVFLFKTDVKNLMIRLYYELNHLEQAYSLVDSYKHFLSSNKEISRSLNIIFSKFLKYYFELLKIKSGQSKEMPSFIISKIEKEKNLVNKKWLLEKSHELLKK